MATTQRMNTHISSGLRADDEDEQRPFSILARESPQTDVVKKLYTLAQVQWEGC